MHAYLSGLRNSSAVSNAWVFFAF